jgi:hypothetical protein
MSGKHTLSQHNRFCAPGSHLPKHRQIMFEDPSNARHKLKRPRISLEAGHWMVHVHARAVPAEILMLQGRARAADRAQAGIGNLRCRAGQPLPVTGLAYIGRELTGVE